MKQDNVAVKWAKRVSLAMAYGGGLILTIMMFLTFFDVFGRSAFNAPIIGSVEILTLMMGLLIFLGVGQTTITGRHIRVDVATQLLPVRPRLVLDMSVQVLSFVTAAIICWRLWVQALEQTAELNVTQNLELPVWFVSLLMAIFSFSLVAGMLVQLIQSWQSMRSPSI